MFRSTPHTLAIMSVILFVCFVGLTFAYHLSIFPHQGAAFVVALFWAFTTSAYLVERCELDLGFHNVVWRSLGLSTAITLFFALLALIEFETLLQWLSIEFVAAVMIWVTPLIATWILLLKNPENRYSVGKKMAYTHIFSVALLLVFLSWLG
jgi:hypothetical protein